MPIIYDLETFKSAFTCSAVGLDTNDAVAFELSRRRNDMFGFIQWLNYLAANKIEMIGYNNNGFDYPVLEFILDNLHNITPEAIHAKGSQIIATGSRFSVVPEWKQRIPQIDLFRIHHFDNVARATSLKSLQFNMRSESVEDLPFPPDADLTDDQIDIVRAYNMHDVTETKKFALLSRELIEFRRDLTAKFGRNFMNANDTKIGKEYFIMRLEEARPGSCFKREWTATGFNGEGRYERKPQQTIRTKIALRDVILPYVRFDHPEFARILDWLRSQELYDTRGSLTDVFCMINGFTFNFGTGGIHGSVTRTRVVADDQYQVIDLDVTSFYPNIAIANRLFPAHLGELFCQIYADVMAMRKQFPDKNAPENKMLKLAANGVYGDSNNVYSPFYDPQYTMSITINGQLLLCMLAERLMMTVPDLQMIQINTDGMTVRVPRQHADKVREIYHLWEGVTRLQIEETDYRLMYIRDVNNYVAVSTKGKVKRKGAYENLPPGERIPTGWHQDCSALVVPKAAEAFIVHDTPIRDFILAQIDPFDFMLRAKAPRGSWLSHGGERVQNTTRFYVSRDGHTLIKISPPDGPLGQFKPGRDASPAAYRDWHAAWGNVWNPEVHTKNKSVYKAKETQICAGWLTSICNRADRFNWENLNYDWYIAEAEKLIK